MARSRCKNRKKAGDFASFLSTFCLIDAQGYLRRMNWLLNDKLMLWMCSIHSGCWIKVRSWPWNKQQTRLRSREDPKLEHFWLCRNASQVCMFTITCTAQNTTGSSIPCHFLGRWLRNITSSCLFAHIICHDSLYRLQGCDTRIQNQVHAVVRFRQQKHFGSG